MCGIGGVYRRGGAVAPKLLHRMVDTLRHRGPDDSGIFASGGVGLAHTRLKVIDLSPLGRQPMLSDDGQVALAYNGEVFNFLGLRTTLARAGHNFRGHSDTEVVLRAYLQWGVASFARLEGMFAFALWDGRERRLHLVRDRFGIKPLYVRHAQGETTFGSEIKTILAAGDVSARADFGGLHEFLYYGTALGERTTFRGIGKLLPGHALTIDERGMRSEPYSPIPDPAPVDDDFETAVETVRGLVGQAVRSHLASDVPVGVFLSGGVDSSAITAFASEHYEGKLKTFTAGFDVDPSSDESAARRVAEHFDTEHHEVRIGVAGVGDVIERLVRCHDAPFGDPADIALFLLSRQIGNDATVILQGDGGDEMFGGYRRHALMSHLPWWRLLSRRTTPMHRMFTRFSREEAAEVVLDALGESDVGMLMARLLASESPDRSPTRVFSADARARLFGVDPFRWHRRQHNRFMGYDLTRRLIALDASITLPDLFFEKVDKPAMYHGIEARVPMVDGRLAEYAMKLPSAYRVRGLEKKVVLRAALRGVVPNATLDRPKTGLVVPIGNWLRTSLADYAKSVLLDAATRRLGLFDESALTHCLERHVAGLENNGRLIYKLLQVALWCHAYRPSFDGAQTVGAGDAKPVVAKSRERGRVMFIVSGLERGGAETQLVGLANGLAVRGWGVTVVCYRTPSDHSLAPELRAPGVKLITLNARPGAWRYASILRAAAAVRRVKPDVLVGLMFHGMMTARLLGRMLGVPVNVSSVHSDRHGALRERLLSLTRALPDSVVALSNDLGRALVRASVAKSSHTRTVPNAIDIDRYEQAINRFEARRALGFEEDRFLWLAAGRLEIEKDYPNMLRAFRNLSERRSDATLLIAGEGAEKASLQASIRRLGLSGRVHLIGLREDMPNLLAASDAVVLSSAWEGMPMVVLEAMAARRPVVATSVGAVPDLIEDRRTGFLAPPRSSAALAAAMEGAMATAGETMTNMMEAAYARVRAMCSTPAVLDQWEGLFDRLLQHRTA